MRRTWKWATLLAGVLVAAPGQAEAQKQVERTFRVRSPSSLRIQVGAGSVAVEGWDRMEVRVSGSVPSEDSLHARQSDRRLDLQVRGEGPGSSELTVWMPRGIALDVESSAGDISVRGAGGLVSVESADGDVEVSGAVRTVTVETISGSVRVNGPARSVLAHTGSGDVRLTEVEGLVDITTAAGSVVLERCRLDQATVTTVEGAISFQGELAEDAVVRFDSYVGEVRLHLRPDIDARFDVSTFGGTVINELGPQAERSSRYAPGQELHFQTGAGTAHVTAETFGGDIRLLRRTEDGTERGGVGAALFLPGARIHAREEGSR